MSQQESQGSKPVGHSEGPHPDAVYGIRQSDCTEEILTEILGIYCEVAKKVDRATGLQRILIPVSKIHKDSVQEGTNSQWRLGSYLSDSKLWIERSPKAKFSENPIIQFRCSDNLDRRYTTAETLEEGRRMEDSFRQAVNTFLLNRGVAIPITPV